MECTIQLDRALLKSSSRSSVDSIPMETRIKPSEIPNRLLSSGDIPECEVVAGSVTSVSTPPRLGAITGSLTAFMKRSAACNPPRSSKLSIPLKPPNSLHARSFMDCAAYLVEMLELGERYFSPTDDPTDSEAEFKELEYEPTLADWRTA